jgi:hypothetical protein
MSIFVLVHGSWHDGSAWKPVIEQLEAKGHLAFAPTIAGHGKGANKNVNHAQCTQLSGHACIWKLCQRVANNLMHRNSYLR